jgi:hypothetical protein
VVGGPGARGSKMPAEWITAPQFPYANAAARSGDDWPPLRPTPSSQGKTLTFAEQSNQME